MNLECKPVLVANWKWEVVWDMMADVLVPNWVLGKPAAFDITITSPLTSIALHEASVTSRSTAQVTENRKHASNDAKCSELGCVCVPLAVEVYGCGGLKHRRGQLFLLHILQI